jgi:membrane protein YdbS with pleckstrin-like domain
MINKNQSPIFVIKPKVIPLIVATSLIFIILSVVIIVFLSIVGSFCISIFLIGILYLLICKYYKNSVYELHKDYLIKKTKLIVTNEVIIQYKNILDITKYQNPIQAKFQLHDLIIRLAGDQHYYCLKNLENAEMIADFINETINVKN